uniref:Uncharacterized protein n=1 Tax=Acrobeloides nanus TaxID=290746 RepID=A0A914BYY4_9BILA
MQGKVLILKTFENGASKNSIAKAFGTCKTSPQGGDILHVPNAIHHPVVTSCLDIGGDDVEALPYFVFVTFVDVFS